MDVNLFYREISDPRKGRLLSNDPSLIRRLTPKASLGAVGNGHSSAVQSVSWSSCGNLLLSGSDDAILKIWDVSRSHTPLHSFDTGHTSFIYGARFMPDTNNTCIATCSADRQVRIIDLHRLAVKPFISHRSKVRSLAAISNFCIISGGEDGTVRLWDVREPGPDRSQEQQRRSLLVEQRSERVGRSGIKVSVNSIAVDPMQPHIFATGGSDPLVRVFDMRMLQHSLAPAGGRAPWIYCFIPEHMRMSLTGAHVWQPQVNRLPTISGIAYTHSGREIVASYTNEKIYLFGTKENARTYESVFGLDSCMDYKQAPVRLRTARRGATDVLNALVAFADDRRGVGPANERIENGSSVHVGGPGAPGAVSPLLSRQEVGAGINSPLASRQRAPGGERHTATAYQNQASLALWTRLQQQLDEQIRRQQNSRQSPTAAPVNSEARDQLQGLANLQSRPENQAPHGDEPPPLIPPLQGVGGARGAGGRGGGAYQRMAGLSRFRNFFPQDRARGLSAVPDGQISTGPQGPLEGRSQRPYQGPQGIGSVLRQRHQLILTSSDSDTDIDRTNGLEQRRGAQRERMTMERPVKRHRAGASPDEPSGLRNAGGRTDGATSSGGQGQGQSQGQSQSQGQGLSSPTGPRSWAARLFTGWPLWSSSPGPDTTLPLHSSPPSQAPVAVSQNPLAQSGLALPNRSREERPTPQTTGRGIPPQTTGRGTRNWEEAFAMNRGETQHPLGRSTRDLTRQPPSGSVLRSRLEVISQGRQIAGIADRPQTRREDQRIPPSTHTCPIFTRLSRTEASPQGRRAEPPQEGPAGPLQVESSILAINRRWGVGRSNFQATRPPTQGNGPSATNASLSALREGSGGDPPPPLGDNTPSSINSPGGLLRGILSSLLHVVHNRLSGNNSTAAELGQQVSTLGSSPTISQPLGRNQTAPAATGLEGLGNIPRAKYRRRDRPHPTSNDASSGPGPSRGVDQGHERIGQALNTDQKGRAKQAGLSSWWRRKKSSAVPSGGGGSSPSSSESDHEADDFEDSALDSGLTIGDNGLGYLKQFEGHRNSLGVKNVCLMAGMRSQYIVSGSDCNNLFVWNAESEELIAVLPGADGVHTVQAHPFDPVLASCGAQPTVKIWSPEAEFAMTNPGVQQNSVVSNIQTGTEHTRMTPTQALNRMAMLANMQMDPTTASGDQGNEGVGSIETSVDARDDEDNDEAQEHEDEDDDGLRVPCHMM